ncbi:hypothetical protein EDF57_105271 [Novosphingobium sp. PhB55]|nr:hypothetical protein EDF57_105271 [Novosphingobium sp. PhB55]
MTHPVFAGRRSAVGTLRQFFRVRPGLAAMLLAAALCLKIFVPTGYMPSAQGGALTVELCSGSAPAGSKVLIHVERKGGSHDASNTADHPCAFSSHSAAALDAVLPALVAAALLFVFVAAVLHRPLALRRLRAQIRPPLRGPPPPA